MSQSDYQIVLEIFIIVIGLYLALFKSYFQEKGKNIATQEDIEAITEKIEKVKSDIEILTHKKITLSSEKQNALLDFNNKYAAWLSYIVNVGVIAKTNPASIYSEKVRDKLEQLFYDYAISEAKIDVFFYSDNELILLKNNIKIKTIELSNHLDLNLVKIENEANMISLANKLPDLAPDNSYKRQELKKHYDKQNAVHADFQINKLELYRVISPLYFQLAKMISNRVHDYEIA